MEGIGVIGGQAILDVFYMYSPIDVILRILRALVEGIKFDQVLLVRNPEIQIETDQSKSNRVELKRPFLGHSINSRLCIKFASPHNLYIRPGCPHPFPLFCVLVTLTTPRPRQWHLSSENGGNARSDLSWVYFQVVVEVGFHSRFFFYDIIMKSHGSYRFNLHQSSLIVLDNLKLHSSRCDSISNQ